MYKKIKSISFPNTLSDEDRGFYTVGKGCDEIKRISKNGENAPIGWFEIIADGKVIAEIKESVCDIFIEEVPDCPEYDDGCHYNDGLCICGRQEGVEYNCDRN